MDRTALKKDAYSVDRNDSGNTCPGVCYMLQIAYQKVLVSVNMYTDVRGSASKQSSGYETRGGSSTSHGLAEHGKGESVAGRRDATSALIRKAVPRYYDK